MLPVWRSGHVLGEYLMSVYLGVFYLKLVRFPIEVNQSFPWLSKVKPFEVKKSGSGRDGVGFQHISLCIL